MAERTLHSVNIVFSGFLISCLIGLPLGILCGSISFFSKLVEPFVDFFRYMPAPTFSTVLVAILAVNDSPKIAMIVLGTVFQMILVLAKTTRLLDRSLLEAAQTLGAKQKQLLFKVTLPGILPNIYNDLRILLGWAWTWLVIAELIGVKSGLTEFIETQGRWRNFDNVYPIIILIGLIGYFTDQFLAWLRRPLFPWLGEPAGPFTRAVIAIFLWVPRWFAAAARERSGTSG
jgi:NitT/TauT family transport system permease protein